MTFRAGGTSLSGQVLGEGIICDIWRGFAGCEPRDGGAAVWCPWLARANVGRRARLPAVPRADA